jgi:predicted adenine nucleotide alpha hydrolase (AANH) superfamily ATPase
MATLLAFCNAISPNESPPKNTEYINEMSKEKLNELLITFYPNARKKNGGNYKKSALMGSKFGLERHFFLKRNFNK